MTPVKHPEDPRDVSDEQLVLRLAAQDRDAFDQLYRRHHDYARRVAMAVAGPHGADDVVADAFADVLVAIFERGNEVHNFRAYLSATIRNTHLAHARHGARVQAASDRAWIFDETDDPDLVELVEPGHAAAALASLPPKWRDLLWRVEVEGRSPSELAELMDMSPSAVSSMSHRARQALRRAFLDRHVPDAGGIDCQWTRKRLSRHVRGELSSRQSRTLEHHVVGCAPCTQVRADLESVNRRIAAALWPVVVAGSVGAVPLVGSGGSESDESHTSSSARQGTSVVRGGLRQALTSMTSTVPGMTAAAVAVVGILGIGAVVLHVIGKPGSADSVVRPVTEPKPLMRVPAKSSEEPPAPRPSEPALAGLAGPERDLSTPDAKPPVPVPVPDPVPVPVPDPDPVTDPDPDPNPDPDPDPDPDPTYGAALASLIKLTIGNYEWSLTAGVTLTSSSTVVGTVVHVAFTIDDEFGLLGVSGAGWTCREPTGNVVDSGDNLFFPPGTTLTCTYQLASTDPPPLRLNLSTITAPTGSAAVSIEGQTNSAPADHTKMF